QDSAMARPAGPDSPAGGCVRCVEPACSGIPLPCATESDKHSSGADAIGPQPFPVAAVIESKGGEVPVQGVHGVDAGAIASLMQHPINSALLVLDQDGRVLAANPCAQALGLPQAVLRFGPLLQDLRQLLVDGSQNTVPCSLP